MLTINYNIFLNQKVYRMQALYKQCSCPLRFWISLLFLFVFVRNIYLRWRVFRKEIWFDVSNVFYRIILMRKYIWFDSFSNIFFSFLYQVWIRSMTSTACKMWDSDLFFFSQPSISFSANNCQSVHCQFIS